MFLWLLRARVLVCFPADVIPDMTSWRHSLQLRLSAEYSLEIVLQGRERAKDLTSPLCRVQNPWQGLRRLGSEGKVSFLVSADEILVPQGGDVNVLSHRSICFCPGTKVSVLEALVSEGMILAACIDPRLRFIHTATFPRSLGADYPSAAVRRSQAKSRTKRVN